jgi:hypothetical protein
MPAKNMRPGRPIGPAPQAPASDAMAVRGSVSHGHAQTTPRTPTPGQPIVKRTPVRGEFRRCPISRPGRNGEFAAPWPYHFVANCYHTRPPITHIRLGDWDAGKRLKLRQVSSNSPSKVATVGVWLPAADQLAGTAPRGRRWGEPLKNRARSSVG